MLAVLTSLRALGGQTGSGQQLCVQALNLCVLGEQKLLKADDLCLEVSHMEKSRHTGLTHTHSAAVRSPTHLFEHALPKALSHSQTRELKDRRLI